MTTTPNTPQTTHTVQTRKGAPRSGFDTDQLRELHAQGLCDAHIARIMRKDQKTVRNYRAQLGLAQNPFNDVSDNGTKHWDIGRARELYDQKCSDAVIAEELGISPTVVCEWRKDFGLPANYAGITDDEEAFAVYNTGAIDRHMAAKLNVSETAVRTWRNKHGLEPHLQRRRIDHESALKMYNDKATDKAIAEVQNVSVDTVRRWRQKNNLSTWLGRR